MSRYKIRKNELGLCAYWECENLLTHWKATDVGVQIGYCWEHYSKAVTVFDLPHYDEEIENERATAVD